MCRNGRGARRTPPVSDIRATHTAIVKIPETMYAKAGESRVAYQVVGDGSVDAIWVGTSPVKIKQDEVAPQAAGWAFARS